MIAGRSSWRPGPLAPILRILSLALACAFVAPAFAQSLAEKRWRFVEIAGEKLDAAARGPATLMFDAVRRRVSASAGCNRMSGSYTLSGATLTFGQMAMTRMACPPPLNRRERALAAALQDVRRWRITKGNLTLSDAKGATLLILFAVGSR